MPQLRWLKGGMKLFNVPDEYIKKPPLGRLKNTYCF